MVANITQIAGSVSGSVALRLFLDDPVAQLESFRDSAGIQREIENFNKKIQKIDDPEDFIKDRRLLNFALSAFQLEGEINNTGRIRKILTEDPESERALQNRLADPRFAKLAQAFRFDQGVAKLSDGAFIEELTQNFVINEFERQLGNQNAALREAAFFLRNIGNVDSELGILGDRVLRSVVTTTLNLPAQIAVQSIDTQERLIATRINLEDFQLNPSEEETVSATDPKTRAETDLNAIGRGSNISQVAIDQVTALLNAIDTVQADYDRVENIQSGTGPYAGEIATQEAAVPELLREQGLLSAATRALGDINGNVARLDSLLTELSDPDLDADGLANKQAEFATLVSDITARVASATFTFDDTDADAAGTAQNLLDGSLSGILSTTLDSAGTIVTAVRAQDLSSFLTDIAAANTSVQSVTLADKSALTAANTSFDGGKSDFDQVNITVQQDASTFNARIGEVTQFAGTLNTADLVPGALAVRDASSRTNLINVELQKIAGLAQQALVLEDGADRTNLVTQFNASVSTVQNLISNAGTGLDNLLNNATDRTYETIGNAFLTARGRDFQTDIADVLNALDIDNSANAQNVIDQVNGAFKTTIDSAFQEIGQDNDVFSFAATTLDPRGAADFKLRQLSDDFENAIANATFDGVSLLSTGFDETIAVGTTGRTTTLARQSNFQTDVLDLLTTAIGKLPSDPADSTGVLAELRNVEFNANRILTNLNVGLRTLSLERSIVDQTLTDINAGGRESFDNIYEATDAAKEFIQRFIITSDSAAFGAQLGLSGNTSRFQTALTLLQNGPLVGGNLNIRT
ncbi:MAG: DUF1217 domain-containing protein [Alphaproteobacteria bacterium]|nr:DUF1217 domain-containing protein [Alphaproteobacteria bacterium]